MQLVRVDFGIDGLDPIDRADKIIILPGRNLTSATKLMQRNAD